MSKVRLTRAQKKMRKERIKQSSERNGNKIGIRAILVAFLIQEFIKGKD